jgi:tetratricopeptide (TPR) repeat protein
MTEPMRRRTLDVRYLTALLVLVALLGVGTHFLHAYQVGRNVDSLMDQANRAEAENHPEKVLEYLGRYVGLKPGDLPARARLALLRDKQAKTPAEKYRAYLSLEDVLRRGSFEKEDQVRRRAAEVAIEMNRPADARDHIERLLAASPNDPGLQELLGTCEEASKQFIKARAAYEGALKQDPKRVGTAFKLARLLHSQLNPAPERDRAADADKVMDAIVEAVPNSLEARLLRCRYMQAVGNLNAAERDLKHAREIDPGNIDVILASALLARDRRRPDEARKFLEEGRKRYPNDKRLALESVRLEMRGGKEHRDEALKQLREAVLIVQDDPEGLWTFADMFIDAADTKEARKLYDRLAELNVPPVSLDFLRARLLAAEGKTGEAVACLERCRAGGAAKEGLSFLNSKMNMLLGTWYEKLENPDQQLVAFERVLADDPLSIQARAGRAAALVKLGRGEEAFALFRSLIDDAPMLRLNAVRLLLARNLRRPPEQRNWEEAERLLQGAPDDVKATTEYRLLRLDVFTVSSRWDEARKLAETCCRESPKEVRFWLARAALAERGPKPDAAAARTILLEAEQQAGDATDLRLALAVRAAGKPADEARKELRSLEEKTDAFSDADRGRLMAGLATVHARMGDNKDAERLLNIAAPLLPADLSIRQQLFDLAILSGDDAAAAKYVEGLHKVEGDEGVLWRYEQAARRVQAARKGETSAVAEAKQLLKEIDDRRRGNWHRVLVLEAEIAEIEGRTDLALELYQKAIERGERSPRVIGRAVQFLAVRRKTDEAKLLLHHAIEQSPTATNDLNRMLVEVSLTDVDSRKQSIKMAHDAVSPNSRDYRDFLWLGQVLFSLGEKKEAEESLRKAIAMRGAAPEPRVALVALLAESGRKDEARAELKRAELELPEAMRLAVMAPCQEALGEAREAESVYADMLKARPNDPSVKHSVAAFYLRSGHADKAEPLLKELAAGDGADSAWARRTLALTMVVSGDYQKTRTALDLLDKNMGGLWASPEDQRARAMVLALRPGDRKASIETLEQSFLRVKPTPAEEFLLAQLYEADRNWTRASERLLGLVSSKQGATPEILAYYIRALLRHNTNGNTIGDARVWLAKLETLEPDSMRTAELKARLLKEDKKPEEAGKFLSEFVKKDYAKRKDPREIARAAALLNDLGRAAESEQLFRLYVEEAGPKHPESSLLLASFLAGHDRISEALDLCERLTARCQPEMIAGVAVGSLRLGQPTAAERDRVQSWLAAEIRKKPESPELLVARADLLDACGDYAGSVKVYRDLLSRRPDNILALNNLAWLLAVHENKGDEALQLIDRAIKIAGPIGDFLDTQASVLVTIGRQEDAVKKLEDAVQQNPTGSRYFHMTQALEKAGRHDSAREAWLKATKDWGLSEKVLHPLERTDFQKFNAEWSTPKG